MSHIVRFEDLLQATAQLVVTADLNGAQLVVTADLNGSSIIQ
jgi:hypothetical protein